MPTAVVVNDPPIGAELEGMLPFRPPYVVDDVVHWNVGENGVREALHVVESAEVVEVGRAESAYHRGLGG